jgi:hypothetical protein
MRGRLAPRPAGVSRALPDMETAATLLIRHGVAFPVGRIYGGNHDNEAVPGEGQEGA